MQVNDVQYFTGYWDATAEVIRVWSVVRPKVYISLQDFMADGLKDTDIYRDRFAVYGVKHGQNVLMLECTREAAEWIAKGR